MCATDCAPVSESLKGKELSPKPIREATGYLTKWIVANAEAASGMESQDPRKDHEEASPGRQSDSGALSVNTMTPRVNRTRIFGS